MLKMLTFSVDGPHEVPTLKLRAGKVVDKKEVGSFWAAQGELGVERGCYLFCIRAGMGVTPAYVGKATKSFRQEVFTDGKLYRYNTRLANTRAGTPVLFFLIHPNRTRTNTIGYLENFLIEALAARYPDLLNVVGTKQARWGIAGVLRGGQGKSSMSAKALKRMLGLQGRMTAASKHPLAGDAILGEEQSPLGRSDDAASQRAAKTRRVSRSELLELIDAGLLPADAALECTLYGVTHAARVRDGAIELEGKMYATPSAAASALRDGKASNGWIIWKYKGELLADIRAKLAGKSQEQISPTAS